MFSLPSLHMAEGGGEKEGAWWNNSDGKSGKYWFVRRVESVLTPKRQFRIVSDLVYI